MKSLSVSEICDLAVEHNLVPDEYFTKWEELGQWQLDVLCDLGLKKDHLLLDFGCGALRFGHLAICFLNDDRYFGIDAFEPYIKLGRQVMEVMQAGKTFVIDCSTDFNFAKLQSNFDFVIAQSVFTHMSEHQIRTCISKIKPFMNHHSKFIFTYYLGEAPKGFLYRGIDPMFRPGLKNLDFFHDIAKIENIEFQLEDISHPTQKVASFNF